MGERLAGTIILYNPEKSVLDNLYSYIEYVEELIVVDNSEVQNVELAGVLKQHDKVHFIENKGNLGIAQALNSAANYAYERGYLWLLTMDQDSIFEDSSIQNLIKSLDKVNETNPDFAILTPVHNLQIGVMSQENTPLLEEIDTCMTSGNILNLNVWKEVGKFEEKLFIDYVDHEFCLRVRKCGFKVYQTSSSTLTHLLGNIAKFKFLGLTRTTSHHNYIRRYYITRNRLYFIKKYFFFDPSICIKEIYNFFAETFKLLLNERDKWRKLKSVLRGVGHFTINRYGKMN